MAAVGDVDVFDHMIGSGAWDAAAVAAKQSARKRPAAAGDPEPVDEAAGALPGTVFKRPAAAAAVAGAGVHVKKRPATPLRLGVLGDVEIVVNIHGSQFD